MPCKTKVREEKLHSCRVSHEAREDPRIVLIENDKVRKTPCSNICPWKCKASQRTKRNPTFEGVVPVRTGARSIQNIPREDGMFLDKWTCFTFSLDNFMSELLIAIICSGLVVGELLSRRSCWKVSRAAANLLSAMSRWQFTDYALLCAHTTPNTKATLLSCLLSIWLKISLSTCTTSRPVCFTLLPVQRRYPNRNLWRWGHITPGISSLIFQLFPVGLYKTTQRNPTLYHLTTYSTEARNPKALEYFPRKMKQIFFSLQRIKSFIRLFVL